jgi:hypothetical protein
MVHIISIIAQERNIIRRLGDGTIMSHRNKPHQYGVTLSNYDQVKKRKNTKQFDCGCIFFPLIT